MTPEAPHILVLEDNATQRRVVAFNLTQAGFKVTEVEKSREALKLAKDQHFDMVVTDYDLPDYLGTDFIKLLRENDSHRHVPVIMLTGKAEELNQRYLYDKLAVLLLAKPCSMAKLVETVSKFFAMAHAS